MFDVKGTRFLYTQQTVELLTRHLVKNFDYTKLRKTDFIDVEAERENNKEFLND